MTKSENVRALAGTLRALIEGKALSAKDMMKGLKLQAKDHPEWGEWIVLGPAKGVSDTWEIKNARGSKVIEIGELGYWRKV